MMCKFYSNKKASTVVPVRMARRIVTIPRKQTVLGTVVVEATAHIRNEISKDKLWLAHIKSL